jgi:hypothetical protein
MAQGDHLCAAVHRERRRDHAALDAHPGPAREGSRHQSAEHGGHDYRGTIEALKFKKAEIGHLGPKAYIEAATNNYANVEPVAQLQLANGSLGYRSCLIVPSDSDVFSPEDTAGKTFAFNDPNSTSGYLVPSTFFMTEMGIDPQKHFSKVIFSGSHEASIAVTKVRRLHNLPDLQQLTRETRSARRPPGRLGLEADPQ